MRSDPCAFGRIKRERGSSRQSPAFGADAGRAYLAGVEIVEVKLVDAPAHDPDAPAIFTCARSSTTALAVAVRTAPSGPTPVSSLLPAGALGCVTAPDRR